MKKTRTTVRVFLFRCHSVAEIRMRMGGKWRKRLEEIFVFNMNTGDSVTNCDLTSEFLDLLCLVWYV